MVFQLEGVVRLRPILENSKHSHIVVLDTPMKLLESPNAPSPFRSNRCIQRCTIFMILTTSSFLYIWKVPELPTTRDKCKVISCRTYLKDVPNPLMCQTVSDKSGICQTTLCVRQSLILVRDVPNHLMCQIVSDFSQGFANLLKWQTVSAKSAYF